MQDHILRSERENRRRASDPALSVWVSANAGAGKTTILTNRVLRLLAQDSDPRRILCLTYTKAAAAEMMQRIFDRLAAWMAMPDPDLAATLAELTGRKPAPGELSHARTLFARAVETPGGLKIQTIHAFCERLLHLFPFEANVPARFRVLDEAEAGEIAEAARRRVIERAVTDPQSALGQALARVIEEAGSADQLGRVLREAMDLLRPRSLGTPVEPDSARAVLGLAEHESLAGHWAAFAARKGPAEWRALAADIEAIPSAGNTDRKLAGTLRAAADEPDPLAAAQAYACAFLTGSGTPLKRLLTSAPARARPDLAGVLENEQARAVEALERAAALAVAERSVALGRLAKAVRDAYEELKQRRGALDFADLIDKGAALLSRPDASWVLAKLDTGLDHILVDEAQDTTPQMWTIVTRFAEEFFAGAGQRPVVRTVFAVGDVKQSIYSFQGAAPEAFEATRLAIGDRLARPGLELISLRSSFRTVQPVLDMVDHVARLPEVSGLARPGEVVSHVSAREAAATGLVEVWDCEQPGEAEADDPFDTADRPARATPARRLAARIAALVARWLRTGAAHADGTPIRAGDVMILVQRRDAFFEAMIRALKQAGVPVAGADRLVIGSHIAVRDCLAAARVGLLAEDDLTLATVLKSPLVGLDEEEVADLARGRPGSLFEALATGAAASPRLAEALARVGRWRERARGDTAFAFFAALLGPDGGRRALVSRLGPDSADAVDALLADALAFGEQSSGALAAYVEASAARDRAIKRDLESEGDAVRVMTVHGAKGLEARIVFLADTCRLPPTQHEPVVHAVPGRDGVPGLLWRRGPKLPLLEQAQEAVRNARLAEHRRLLYVAMTRARDRLYVAGHTGKRFPAGCWHDLVKRAIEPVGAQVPAEDGQGEVWRFPPQAPLPAARPRVAEAASLQDEPEPVWLRQPAGPEPGARPPLRPSRLVDAAEAAAPRPGEAALAREARDRGILVHRLFETLPSAPAGERLERATRFLERRLGASERNAALAGSVVALLDHPDLAALMGPAARAELALAGEVRLADGRLRPVSARLDRLLITREAATILDIKTGRPPADPERPPATVLAQMALYRALVHQLLPGRPVRAAVLWTALPRLVTVSAAALDEAYAGITLA